MSVRWESPGGAGRRRSGGSVDECEISMLSVANDDGADGDHSRSRNGSVSGCRTDKGEEAKRTAISGGGGRCPVARVDVDLSDDEERMERDDSEEIVVLDEACERLLGKWNGNAKLEGIKAAGKKMHHFPFVACGWDTDKAATTQLLDGRIKDVHDDDDDGNISSSRDVQKAET
uniref:Uncharacterized protein n=1 Tax=Anopheles farauti TaxID=69004 RepID=A0A182QN64_9DIPT